MRQLAGVHGDLPLAPTLAPLGDRPRAALDRLAAMGFRHVQLSAMQPGLRPRDLDRSGRRDLGVCLGRLELTAAGVDLWIPQTHFVEPDHVDRAVAAVLSAIELAGDLDRCPLSFALPDENEQGMVGPIVEAITDYAVRHGVQLADHAVPPVSRDYIGVGIDPPSWLGLGEDPAAAASTNATRLVSARLCDLLTCGMRGPIGETHGGRLDVLAYKVAIATSGYSRPVVVDARQWSDPWLGLEQTTHAWAAAT
ncbi:MAG: hypothetical protein O6758_05720 [Planctomycetota bacterium]|nr:hypothetical protein [Planctomycetota bacterium]